MTPRRPKKPNRLDDIARRMSDAELAPWKKKRGSFGWYILSPKDAHGCHDVLIASGLDGDLATFLENVPEDMRWMLGEIESLRYQLKQKRKKK